MALPSQVEAAAAAADELLAQMNAPQSVDPEPQPEAQPVQQAPEVAPVVQQEPVAPPANVDRQLEQAEQRYRTLQGIMNKEIHSLDGQVKTLTKQLETALDRLNQQAKQQEAQPVRAVSDPKDVENFGSDLVEMVNRVAAVQLQSAGRLIEGKLAELEARIAKLGEQMGHATQASAATAEQLFFEKLGKLVPNWEQINADQRFLSWLAEADPVYGVPRQMALDNAQKSLSPERVAAVFKAFAGPTPTAPKVDPLDKQVSPKGSGAPAPVQQDQRFVTSQQITQFYDDVRRGAYRGKEAEAQRLESMFNQALAEGRVR